MENGQDNAGTKKNQASDGCVKRNGTMHMQHMQQEHV